MRRSICILLSLTLGLGSVKAQQNQVTDLGFLTYMVDFKDLDILGISQTNRSLGTARSAAMGGAFTSLGADMSTMSINPAGLGMYTGSEFSISPSLSISKNSNSRVGGIDNIDGTRGDFGLGNIGVALNIYQDSGPLTSVTIGFSYNKLVNFSSRNEYGVTPNGNSIADVFAGQLNNGGYREADLQSNRDPFDNYNLPTYIWGGILAYQSFLVDPVTSNSYGVFGIADGVQNSHYADMLTKGSVGESNISMGMNFSNIFYAGFSVGIKNVDYSTSVNYEEAYIDNLPSDKGRDEYYLDYMSYRQGVDMSGTGVDFKFGIIVRPIGGLKIGVAVHTPSYYSLNRTYYADMYTQTTQGYLTPIDRNEARSNDLVFAPKFTTPTRLLTGISYTFGQYAILSFDYERAWYNNMRLKDEQDGMEADFKASVKENFTAQDNFRAGIELRPLPSIFLRGGYFNSGTMVQDDSSVYNAPIAVGQSGYSFGLGCRINNWSLDLAYTMSNTKYSMYDLYYFDNGTDFFHTGDIVSERDNHIMTLTTSIRF